MYREQFWNGFYVYVVIQSVLIMAKFVGVIEWSGWITMIPTFLVITIGLAFLVYFGLTCNPRIEKDEDEA